jgi:hypothetical protein
MSIGQVPEAWDNVGEKVSAINVMRHAVVALRRRKSA